MPETELALDTTKRGMAGRHNPAQGFGEKAACRWPLITASGDALGTPRVAGRDICRLTAAAQGLPDPDCDRRGPVEHSREAGALRRAFLSAFLSLGLAVG